MADESPGHGESRTESFDGEFIEFTGSQIAHARQEPPTTPEPDSPRVRREALVDVWLVLAVYFLPNTYAAIEEWFHPRPPVPLAWSESALTVRMVAFVALGFYLIVRCGEPFAAFGLTRPRVSDLFFGGLLCGLMFLTAGVCVYLMPSDFLGARYRSAEQLWMTPQTAVEYALVVVAACVNALGEEVMARAFFQTRMEQATRAPVWSVVVTAVLFGGYHAYYGPVGVVTTFALGLVLGTYFRVTRRFWVLVIAHTVYNTLSMPGIGS